MSTPQPAPKSCSECSRRKRKCNKEIPCSSCIQRSVPHLCRVEVEVEAVDIDELSTAQLKAYALSELLSLRETIDKQRSKISRLELVLSKALDSSAADIAQPTSTPGQTHHHHVKHEQHPTQHYPSSLVDSKELSPENGEAALAEQEAGLALEYLALGRERPSAGAKQDNNTTSPADIVTEAELERSHLANRASISHHAQPSPSADYPDPTSWAKAAPTTQAARTIITHTVDHLGWLLGGVVHAPTFHGELEGFWATGSSSFSTHSPAFCALYFAVLTIGIALLPPQLLAQLNLTHAQAKQLSKRWFGVTIAALYRANFLENHSTHALQAIAALCLAGRDAWSATTVATLLTTGLSIAQDLGMHQMSSDEAFNRHLAKLPTKQERAKALIAREVNKRIFYSLIREDYFAISYRRSYALRPSQISTPLPLNLHDADLAQGRVEPYDEQVCTVVGFLLMKVKLARRVQRVFECLDNGESGVGEKVDSYAFLEKVTREVQRDRGPQWIHLRTSLDGLPHHVEWARIIYYISSRHKLLTIHRPFSHRASKDPRFAGSQSLSVTAAREILLAAPQIGNCRVWTIMYHISAACFILCLNLFQNPASPDLEEQRKEIRQAVEVLRKAAEQSEIAQRGVNLIEGLLSEEEKGRQERITVKLNSASSSPALTSGGTTSTAASRKRVRTEDVPPPSPARGGWPGTIGARSPPFNTPTHSNLSLHPAPSPANALHDPFLLPSATHSFAPHHLPGHPPTQNSGSGLGWDLSQLAGLDSGEEQRWLSELLGGVANGGVGTGREQEDEGGGVFSSWGALASEAGEVGGVGGQGSFWAGEDLA